MIGTGTDHSGLFHGTKGDNEFVTGGINFGPAQKEPDKVVIKVAASMDISAVDIIRQYISEHLDKSDPEPVFDVYIVWKCKALQNWKYLISSTLSDGMYYELTYNGDKKEWYLDAYKKFENRVIPG